MLRRPALLLPLLALAGCLAMHPPAERVPAAPPFRPEVFFDGRTEGLGTLRVRAGGAEVVRVESVGAAQEDGAFRLDQIVTRGDGEPTTRTWLLRLTSPTTYTGTLTDASGEVRAEVDGSVLRIRYPMGTATTMRQTLYLQPGGDVALNLATVSVLGVPVARLEEQIRRVGPPRPATPSPGRGRGGAR